MKKIRRIAGIAIIVFVLVALTACGDDEEDAAEEEPGTLSATVEIAAAEPSSMSMIKLMGEKDYSIETYDSAEDVEGQLLSGQFDVAAVPAGLAASLYNKTSAEIVAVSPVTLNSLFIVENGEAIQSVDNLYGRTIVACGEGETSQYILNRLLEEAYINTEYGIAMEWVDSQEDVIKALEEPYSVGMLTEPYASEAAEEIEGVRLSLDMGQLWNELTGEDFPLEVLVAQKSFIKERGDDLQIFLDDYAASIDFINNSGDDAAAAVVDKKLSADTKTAKEAIKNSRMVLYSQTDRGRSILENFYTQLAEYEKERETDYLGGGAPKGDFYH